jgi:hypothetical protein
MKTIRKEKRTLKQAHEKGKGVLNVHERSRGGNARQDNAASLL